jgi:hypothetical protein
MTGVEEEEEIMLVFGVEDVGLGEASIDWTVGSPLLRGWVWR